MHSEDLSEPKDKFLIKRWEDAGIKHLDDLNAFIECSNIKDHVYKNIDGYNPRRKRKVLVVLDDLIADIRTNKKISSHN